MINNFSSTQVYSMLLTLLIAVVIIGVALVLLRNRQSIRQRIASPWHHLFLIGAPVALLFGGLALVIQQAGGVAAGMLLAIIVAFLAGARLGEKREIDSQPKADNRTLLAEVAAAPAVAGPTPATSPPDATGPANKGAMPVVSMQTTVMSTMPAIAAETLPATVSDLPPGKAPEPSPVQTTLQLRPPARLESRPRLGKLSINKLKVKR